MSGLYCKTQLAMPTGRNKSFYVFNRSRLMTILVYKKLVAFNKRSASKTLILKHMQKNECQKGYEVVC